MLSVVALSLAASISVIDSISIESRWGGLGDPSATTYTILRSGDHQYRRNSATVSKEAVDRLAAALAAPPVDRSEALRALATNEWLKARATEPHSAVFVPECSAEAKRVLAQHLSDRDVALKELDSYFSSRWTDDYPFVSIDIAFHDGRAIHLESSAQHALMLPWKVGDAETWNPEIPRAVAGLLPDGAEFRLTDGKLASAYVEEVAQHLRDRLDDLEERCVHRTFLSSVEKAFQVVRVYHGSPGWFTAYVRRPEFPSNLVLTLVIRDADNPDAQEKLERTIRRASEYVNIVRGYVAKHPKKHFAIWCADGISVEGNDRAVRLSEYDPASGIVSRPRTISADGSLADEGD